MQPVWVLSVDLQTKTATFQSGLSDAAKSARGAFSEIKQGSGEMGREVSGNMMEARHGVILLGEEFGIHLPRGVTTFLASIGPVGAAMEAAFPFLAIAVGATLLIEHLVALHAAGVKLTDDQAKFATATQVAFNSLDEKLLQAGIRTDELHNNHLAALEKQLKLINMQSMDELVHQFEEVAKTADIVFEDLKSHWYTLGTGGDGAKASLNEFKNAYEDLQSKGKDKEASALLQNKLERETKILALQKEYIANSGTLLSAPKDSADSGAAMRALLELKKMGAGYTENEMKAQEVIVGALTRQEGIQARVAAGTKAEGDNDRYAKAMKDSSEQSAGARESADSQVRMGQQAIAADKAVAEAQLTIKRASVQERLDADLDFAQRDYDLQAAGNDALIAALDKMAPGYINSLKALKDKALELEAAHAAQVAEITSKASVAQSAKDLAALEQGEREKIDATQKACAARLAAINDAIKQEESAGLQDTNFYRDLLTQRVQLTEQMREEAAKLQEQAGKEAADNEQKMGELSVQALKQANALKESAERVTEAKRVADETAVADAEFQVKAAALAREIATLDTSGKDYQNKLKELQDKEKQLVQAHEDEITAIKEKAKEARDARILSAETRFTDSIAAGLTRSIMGHESWAKMVTSLGDQVVSGMLENAIKSMLTDDMTKERDAAKAARSAFKIGISMGGPAGIVLGPVMGAAAFAAVMAFQGGTDSVPGVGTGDIVPAMLEPGEGVVPKGVMEQLSNMAKNGGMGGSAHVTHVHVNPTYHVNTVDGDGMQDALEKHTDVLTKHFETTLRKMNR